MDSQVEYGGFCVVSRMLGDYLQIGPIIVQIHKVKGRRVYLSVRAPKDMRIIRPEASSDSDLVPSLTAEHSGDNG